jgi:hypothetical protein
MHTDFCPKIGQMGQMGRPTNGQEIDFSAHGPKWVDPFGPAHGFCPGLPVREGDFLGIFTGKIQFSED